ncbi:MAG: hypothetical protein ACJAVV_000797 [Alphaproteobacteria bacterium]
MGKQQISLLVLEMETGSMLVNKVLPFFASKLAWQTNDEAIILSIFLDKAVAIFSTLISSTIIQHFPQIV